MPENTNIEEKVIAYLSTIYPKTETLHQLKHHLEAVSSGELNKYLLHSDKVVKGTTQDGDVWGLKKQYVRKQTPQIAQQRPTTTTTEGTATIPERPVRPSVPVLLDPNVLHHYPSSADVYKLFRFCVHKVVNDGIWKDTYNHNSWANKIFTFEHSYENRVSMMSKVKSEYGIYFMMHGTKYQFDMEKIMDHYPMWFKGCGDIIPIGTEDPAAVLHYEVLHALYKEFREASIDKNVQKYKVDNLTEYNGTGRSKYIYVAQLSLREGEEPRLREGVTVGLKIGKYEHPCEVVEYNNETAELTVTSPIQLSTDFHTWVIVDTTFILNKLRERWNGFASMEVDESLPVYKFILGDTRDIQEVEYQADEAEQTYGLDEPQLEAYRAALGNDLTMIWGPPGTGKSFTLAAIIRSLYKQPKERTVVCCVSNVAVDQLVNKVVDIIEQEGTLPAPGNYYRAGHTIDERIIGTDFLFPNDETTKEIRQEIREKKERIDVLKRRTDGLAQEYLIKVKAELKDLRENLKNHTDYLVQNSRVVFSTISNFIINEKLYQSQFDNLIVDEASMLAIPQLVAIAGKVSKRIILVGDFKQLSPIALVPDNHLRKNVFALCDIGTDRIEHPALYPLLNQRRSYKPIVSIINKRFYDNKLNPTIMEPQPIVDMKPYPGKPIVAIDMKGSESRYTKGGTRQNKESAKRVIELLDTYAQQELADYSIGIISPYKGQTSLIKALMTEREYTEDFLKHVRIGTVHTFQGSECDIIICDFVDSANAAAGNNPGIGKIYAGKEGEQLLNVAVSRARHKLIVLGDMDHLSNPIGATMSTTTMNVFKELKGYKV